MALDANRTREWMDQWEKSLAAFKLPTWEELPALPLYMDQVIYLLNDYLSFFAQPGEEDKLVTSAMVNNYVKNKLVPAPVKKRYGRGHLAYLIMICLLKQSMNTMDIPVAVPAQTDEESVKGIYEAFLAQFGQAAKEQQEAARGAEEMLAHEESAASLIFRTAAQANFSRLLIQQLLHLDHKEEKATE